MTFVLGRFEIVRTLARNQDGYSALVRDVKSETTDLVLRVLQPGKFPLDRHTLSEFYGWCQTQTHPNLGRILSAGLGPRKELYWTRRYCPIPQKPRRPDSWIKDLVSAVVFLHANGYLHQRIRPSNILADAHTLQLVDARNGHTSTRTSSMADIHFTAPEVLRGEPPSVSGDLYSLGATLYQAITGRTIFEDEDISALKSKYLHAAPTRLQSLNVVAEPLAAAIDGLLSKQPRQRLTAMHALRLELAADVLRTAHSPFPGRRAEMETIREQAFQSNPALSVVCVESAHGIGKTRLLGELRSASPFYIRDFASAVCRPSDVGLEPVRAALIEIVRVAAMSSRDGFPFLRKYGPGLPEFFSGEDSATSPDVTAPSTQQLISDLVGLLVNWSAKGSLVLAFDDVHYASPSMTGFLMQLCLRAREVSGTLILTGPNSFVESSWLSRFHHENLLERFRTICLLPLTETDSGIVLDHLDHRAEARDKILANAAGNPLFIREGAKASKGAGPALATEATGAWLETALRDADESVPDIIRFLALVDRPFPLDKLRAATKLPPQKFPSAIISASRADLIDAGPDGIILRHRLSIAEPIYISIPAGKRVQAHATAFRALSEAGADLEIRASQALNGHLYKDAFPLCFEAAARLKQQGHFDRAIEYYLGARKAAELTKQSLPPVAELDMAECYARTGKHRKSRTLYERLLSSSYLANNPAFMPLLYTRLADPERTLSNSERLHLCQMALAGLPPDSRMSGNVLMLTVQTLANMGRVDEAETALEKARAQLPHQDSRTRRLLAAARGLIHLGRGRFREAANQFGRISLTRSGFSVGIMANLALSFEHMGRLQVAETWLARVRAIAENSGYAFGQIMSHNNLGSVLRKQGRFEEAAGEFATALSRLEGFRSLDHTFPLETLAIIRLDLAMLQCDRGQYAPAYEALGPAAWSDERTAMDNMFIALHHCHIYQETGAAQKAERLLARVHDYPLCQLDCFQIEIGLLEASAKEPDSQTAERLAALIQRATPHGSLHQECRLRIALGSQHLLQNPVEAKSSAAKALKIARKNGYKPLEAQAMMVRGLASEHAREKEHWLIQAQDMASAIGLPELTAESAYHIGALLLNEGQLSAGREWLLNSTTITSGLAEQIPPAYRSRYLSRPWRKEARALLEQSVREGPAQVSRENRKPAEEDDRYFRALYRTSLAAGHAETVDGLLAELLKALDLSIRHPLLILAKTNERPQWRALRTEVSQELKEQLLAIAGKGGDEAHFEYQNLGITRGTIAWIPFRSPEHSGGIYVACRKGEAMSEREMEFLTILGTLVRRAFDQIGNRRSSLPAPAAAKTELHGIIGSSPVIRELRAQIATASSNDAPVLIEGETGTGKELVARAIHKLSNRTKSPFIAVDCGAIPEGLIESELFGYKRGAFTGAAADKPGLFEAANGGTLFLDEISNMNFGLQAKLLRVLQEREIRRVGETRGRPIDVRIIAAANKNLRKLVEAGGFRQDLLYRLNVLGIIVPPLRDRREDIPALAAHFMSRLNTTQKTGKVMGRAALDSLLTHDFPGNIRELQNAVERSFFTAKGNTVSSISIDRPASPSGTDEVQTLFKELCDGKRNFWTTVHDRYKRRDISRETVRALIDLGLHATGGSYKDLTALFRIGNRGYRRLMDFLRRNDCLLDFRPYRTAAARK